MKHSIISIIQTSHHQRYSGAQQRTGVCSCNSKSEVYHGNSSGSQSITCSCENSRSWKEPSESFPGHIQLFFTPQKLLS